MAVLKNKSNAEVSGKLGPVVVTTWRGLDILRTRPTPSGKPPSAKQLRQREKFRLAVAALQPFRETVNRFYSRPEGNKSRYDLALSHVLNRAIEFTRDTPAIDYRRMLLSRGELTAVSGLQVSWEGVRQLRFEWNDNSAEGNASQDDRVWVSVLAQDHSAAETVVSPSQRSDSGTLITLPQDFPKGNVHVFVWFENLGHSLVSNSSYGGILKLA